MSLIPKESIKIIAQLNGLNPISDELALAVAPDVEYRIREVAQEAVKFMRHCKRSRLTVDDVNDALRLRRVEQLHGFSAKEGASGFKKVGKDLYVPEDHDKEIDFKDIIAAPRQRPPPDCSLTAHWLAIEGAQPRTPQNPHEGYEGLGALKREHGARSDQQDSIVRPVVHQVVSKELQDYFQAVTTTVQREDGDLLDDTLRSMAKDPSAAPLVPYFVQFVADEMAMHLTDLRLLYKLMRLVDSLLSSPYHHIEPYLHQLMPSLLTCLLGKRLCNNPSDDHWYLRDYSASLLGIVCQRFGGSISTLQPRIAKTLLQAFLDKEKPMGTHYGAVVGITQLGPHYVKLILVPKIKTYMEEQLDPHLKSESSGKEGSQMAAKKIFGALLKAGGSYIYKVSTGRRTKKSKQNVDMEEDAMVVEESLKEEETKEESEEKREEAVEGINDEVYQELFDIFGEALLPYVAKDSENLLLV